MRRRAVLFAICVGSAGTAGCASKLSGIVHNGSHKSTAKNDSCEYNTPTKTMKPTKENTQFNYSCTRNADHVQQESFTLVNTGDTRVDYSGYRVAFEKESMYKIDGPVLLPNGELTIITASNSSTTSPEPYCANHVVQHHLKKPLFADYHARVSLVAPDGSHVLTRAFDMSRWN